MGVGDVDGGALCAVAEGDVDRGTLWVAGGVVNSEALCVVEGGEDERGGAGACLGDVHAAEWSAGAGDLCGLGGLMSERRTVVVVVIGVGIVVDDGEKSLSANGSSGGS